MGVKIRLKRYGTKKRPFYRLVVVDSRQPRDGRTIEEVGLYHPIEVEEWIQKGARPTDTVRRLLNKNKLKPQEEKSSSGEDD